MRFIPRSHDGKLAHGGWQYDPDEPTEVIVACPGCGTIAQLDHEIAPDGTVTPSVVCPANVPCGFHEYIKLENYEEKK